MYCSYFMMHKFVLQDDSYSNLSTLKNLPANCWLLSLQNLPANCWLLNLQKYKPRKYYKPSCLTIVSWAENPIISVRTCSNRRKTRNQLRYFKLGHKKRINHMVKMYWIYLLILTFVIWKKLMQTIQNTII